MTLCVFFQLKESFYNKRNNLSWCDISEIWVLCHGLKKDLGGWPICLKSMVIDIKWEAKPFFSKSKGRKSYFFNVTPWRSVQIWGDLPRRKRQLFIFLHLLIIYCSLPPATSLPCHTRLMVFTSPVFISSCIGSGRRMFSLCPFVKYFPHIFSQVISTKNIISR